MEDNSIEFSDSYLKDFNYVKKEIKSIETHIDTTLQILNNDEIDNKAISLTTKKRLTQKLIQSLQITKSNLPTLNEHLFKIQDTTNKWKKLFMQAEDSRISAMQELGHVVEKYDESLEKARTEQAEKNKLIKKNEELNKKIEEMEIRHRNLEMKCKSLEEEYLSRKSLFEESNSNYGMIKEENDGMKKELEKEKKKILDLNLDLNEIKSKDQKLVELNKTQKEVMAKLTADNLIFMMKLKDNEKIKNKLEEENKLLKETLQEKKGPWFDEVRENVELQIKKSYVLCEELENELEKLSQKRLVENQKNEEEIKEIKEELKKEEELNLKLKEEIEEISVKEQEMREDKISVEKEKEEINIQLKAFITEKEVLNENIKTIRDESSQIWMKYSELKSEFERLEEKEREYLNEKEIFEKKNKELENKIKLQISVNEEIMKKKEECEWELMGFKAKFNIDKDLVVKDKSSIAFFNELPID